MDPIWLFLLIGAVLLGGTGAVRNRTGRRPTSGASTTRRPAARRAGRVAWRGAAGTGRLAAWLGRRGFHRARHAGGHVVTHARAVRRWQRRRHWVFGPRHADATVSCSYCGHRSATTEEALAHATTHEADYAWEVLERDPPPSTDPAPEPTDAPTPDTPPENTMPPTDTAPTIPSPFGTAGRALVAGMVLDWETSVQARQDPETFVAWLKGQAATLRHAATVLPDLVAQCHGRGPTGHAGVPEEQLDTFIKTYLDSLTAQANAYERWAKTYSDYVGTAEDELVRAYGPEVLAAARRAHMGS